MVVYGWPLVPKYAGRLRTARGRLRMALGSKTGRLRMACGRLRIGPWPSTDGPWPSADHPTGARTTVRKPVEIPQSQILDNFVDMPTVVLRQVPLVRIVQKSLEIPQVPIVRTVLKPVEIPQLQFLDMPVVVQRQMAMIQTERAPLEIHTCSCLSCPLFYNNRSPTTITVASTVFPTATVPITSLLPVHRQDRRHLCRDTSQIP